PSLCGRAEGGPDPPACLGSLLPPLLEQAPEELEDLRVERGARVALHDAHGLRVTERRPVAARRRQRIIYVRNAEDPCGQRNLGTTQAVRVRLSVPALVVVAHDRPDVPGEVERSDDLVTDGRVAAHQRPLLVVQDRKSTRLNSSHVKISYAVFCLKTKRRVR